MFMNIIYGQNDNVSDNQVKEIEVEIDEKTKLKLHFN